MFLQKYCIIVCIFFINFSVYSKIDSLSYYKLNNSIFIEGFSKKNELVLKAVLIGDTSMCEDIIKIRKLKFLKYLDKEDFAQANMGYFIVLYYKNIKTTYKGEFYIIEDSLEKSIDIKDYTFKEDQEIYYSFFYKIGAKNIFIYYDLILKSNNYKSFYVLSLMKKKEEFKNNILIKEFKNDFNIDCAYKFDEDCYTIKQSKIYNKKGKFKSQYREWKCSSRKFKEYTDEQGNIKLYIEKTKLKKFNSKYKN